MLGMDDDGEDSEEHATEMRMGKKKGKISKEEAAMKLHQLQMQSLDGEIQSMISSKIADSPRYSGDGGSGKGSLKKGRPGKLEVKKKKAKTGGTGRQPGASPRVR